MVGTCTPLNKLFLPYRAGLDSKVLCSCGAGTREGVPCFGATATAATILQLSRAGSTPACGRSSPGVGLVSCAPSAVVHSYMAYCSNWQSRTRCAACCMMHRERRAKMGHSAEGRGCAGGVCLRHSMLLASVVHVLCCQCRLCRSLCRQAEACSMLSNWGGRAQPGLGFLAHPRKM